MGHPLAIVVEGEARVGGEAKERDVATALTRHQHGRSGEVQAEMQGGAWRVRLHRHEHSEEAGGRAHHGCPGGPEAALLGGGAEVRQGSLPQPIAQ